MPLIAETPFQVVAAALDAAASEAGALAMQWFRAGARTTARTDYKHGGSPVTEADLAVDRFLRERLTALFPDAGWLSEETADSPARLEAASVFIVDPIDGTRGFAEGDARWSVSAALVRAGRPVAGRLSQPLANRHDYGHAACRCTGLDHGSGRSADGVYPTPRA